MRRRLLLALPSLLAAPALAQPRPPIRILVGFAPGGTADQVARIAGEAIQRRGGPNIVVEIRSGALGFIALQAVARSAPDGTTLGIGIMGQLAVAPVVPGSQIPLDLDRELAPIAALATTPMALVVRPDAPFRSVAELVAHAKARPAGALTYGSTGNGSTNQLGAEGFAAAADLKLTHVAYRGGTLALLDLAAGRIDLFFANIAEVAEMVRGGQVRALALAADAPIAMFPDLPLLTADYPSLAMGNWLGLVGPAGLPEAQQAELAGLFLAALADPVTTPVLASRGLSALGEAGPAFAARIRRDRDRWAQVAKAGNIRAD
ncbi:Bug family tripartite tricarboxylate transporter substrate binding protein [Siccirubricoccus phaeus]|uniref:Bug family tripartite tricarboxylate transporter substrate binding protein n=1 Tax=Siccirubricoccus phaeus TaxID=2595053 RepID=UPI0011F1F1B3|nr:tripartite tricarboxylate transporter substrate binding protein [Siccirubricoccus phaeus]